MINFVMYKLEALIVILCLLLAGGIYTASTQETHFVQSDSFSEKISTNVNDVNNAVIGVQLAVSHEEIGQFRATWQDAQQLITSKYQDALKDTTLTPEQRQINNEYKEYLMECSRVVDSYSKGQTPDLIQMNSLKEKLN